MEISSGSCRSSIEEVKNIERGFLRELHILRGEELTIDCPYPVSGDVPELVRLATPGDVLVSYRTEKTDSLQLVPRVLALGIGAYAVIAVLEYRKIGRVPMDEALKNAE